MVRFPFLPVRCLTCGAPGGPGGLCRACSARFQGVGLPDARLGVCPVCGQQRLAETRLCVDCSSHGWSFPTLDGVSAYNDPPGELVRLYKFGDQKRLVSSWVGVLGPRLAVPWPLVPVPPLARHLWWRGWDPVETLARALGRARGLPVWHPLVRHRSRAQKSLDTPGRWANAEKAYSLSPRWRRKLATLEGVWLVDDVVTTGATVEVCARLLLSAGVGEVRVVGLAVH